MVAWNDLWEGADKKAGATSKEAGIAARGIDATVENIDATGNDRE